MPAGIYNLGSGRGYSLHDIVNVIRTVSGVEPVVEYRPARMIDVPAIVLDVSRIERELGWRARVTITEGIQRLRHELDSRPAVSLR